MIEQIALLKGCKVRLEIWLVEGIPSDGIKAMMVLKAMDRTMVVIEIISATEVKC
jgi:hypothetical protein